MANGERRGASIAKIHKWGLMREIATILTSSPLRQINATIILIVIDTTKIAIVQIIYNLLII